MPLSAKGKKVLAAMKAKHGNEEGERMFYAMENSDKHKGLKKAADGATVTSRHQDLADGFDGVYAQAERGINVLPPLNPTPPKMPPKMSPKRRPLKIPLKMPPKAPPTY